MCRGNFLRANVSESSTSLEISQGVHPNNFPAFKRCTVVLILSGIVSVSLGPFTLWAQSLGRLAQLGISPLIPPHLFMTNAQMDLANKAICYAMRNPPKGAKEDELQRHSENCPQEGWIEA